MSLSVVVVQVCSTTLMELFRLSLPTVFRPNGCTVTWAAVRHDAAICVCDHSRYKWNGGVDIPEHCSQSSTVPNHCSKLRSAARRAPGRRTHDAQTLATITLVPVVTITSASASASACLCAPGLQAATATNRFCGHGCWRFADDGAERQSTEACCTSESLFFNVVRARVPVLELPVTDGVIS